MLYSSLLTWNCRCKWVFCSVSCIRHKQTSDTAVALSSKYLWCGLVSSSSTPWSCEPEWSLVTVKHRSDDLHLTAAAIWRSQSSVHYRDNFDEWCFTQFIFTSQKLRNSTAAKKLYYLETVHSHKKEIHESWQSSGTLSWCQGERDPVRMSKQYLCKQSLRL